MTDVFALLPNRPRLLALGEPTHGANLLLEKRNDLFRQIAAEGYRTIALESDCLMGLIVDDYVTTGTGNLDEALARGFSHEWGAFPGNRDLVQWMRAHNEGRPPVEQVRFAGFDGPLEITGAASPRQALTALGLDADDLIGPDERWTNPAAMMDPSRSVGRSPEAGQLRDLLDKLPVGPDPRAQLYARTAKGLLRYHYWMADTSPNRLAELLQARAAMMAGNLLALAEQGPAFVYAHNSHLQRTKSSMTMGGQRLEWQSAGATVSEALGDGYAFLATAIGTLREHGVGTPPPDTIEGLLYAHPQDLVDPRTLPRGLTPRVPEWFGYAPLDPDHLTTVDGIVYVKDAV